MNELRFSGLGKTANQSFSFAGVIPLSGITALWGRSGSGKTTLLRWLAGLPSPLSGQIIYQDLVWQDGPNHIPTESRHVGLVFQEDNLFSHLSVSENLCYGLKRCPPARRKFSYEEIISFFQLEDLLNTRPHQLSGGQRQRVAIARTLLYSPEMIFFDEPASALDDESKAEIFHFLNQVKTTLHLPMVYVTHSRDEVFALADQVLKIENGSIVLSGKPQDCLSPSPLSQSARTPPTRII